MGLCAELAFEVVGSDCCCGRLSPAPRYSIACLLPYPLLLQISPDFQHSKMLYAVANLAKLWHLLTFCDDNVLVRILEGSFLSFTDREVS